MRTAIDPNKKEVNILGLFVGIRQAIGWEHFVLKRYKGTNDVVYGFVQSPICPEGEYGDFSVSEIKPHAIYSDDLENAFPPEGWKWK